MNTIDKNNANYVPVQNPCKLCSPLGASLVFKGIEQTVGLLHGSQGCSTYIRRYLISHFKEPVDIASSNFSEETAIYGGSSNLKTAIDNVASQYHPKLIGVASTCLSETIGDDVAKIIKEYKEENNSKSIPEIVHVSTPSYNGSHIDGFHAAVRAIVSQLAKPAMLNRHNVNIFPGMVSPEDLRYLKKVVRDFKLDPIILPDYSETLDGPAWDEYQILPKGGTSIYDIRTMGASTASVEFGTTQQDTKSASSDLKRRCGVVPYKTDLPIGLYNSDRFFEILQAVSGRQIPAEYLDCRGRLLDAYIDGHKHTFGVKVGIYGEEDWVIAMARFVQEIGMIPVLCASGGKSGQLKSKLTSAIQNTETSAMKIVDGADFDAIERAAEELKPDLLLGNSKGYRLSKKIHAPLIRIGFPIHDRIGGQRILHIGYHGALRLFDEIVNTIIAQKQESSDIGYAYL